MSRNEFKKKVMSNYRNNHYVPQWYQKRFILPEQERKEFFYLDLDPEIVYTDKNGEHYYANPLKIQGTEKSFKQEDLYTEFFGENISTQIEERFFGKVDDVGTEALDFIEGFDHRSLNHQAFRNLVIVMSLQKLRTPKGLNWLAQQTNIENHNELLRYMMWLRSMHGAIWMESTWQIANADNSETKFILTDHPITVYNKRCGPRHRFCRGVNDPDIRLAGSHTIFPLSYNKVLIITNTLWVKDPYQNPLTMRPNPDFFRSTIMALTDIQIDRYLSEQEVREINFVLKSRAHKYVASPVKEWLYPEHFVSRSDWANLGDELLFMPDPRSVNYGGEIIVGYETGAEGFDQYGRRPWEEDYGKDPRRAVKYDPLYRFKGEFARYHGPKKRGLVMEDVHMTKSDEYSEDMHNYHLSLAKRKKS